MATAIQIKRRINGAAGSPSATGASEGELALNFPGVAGGTTKPELWAFDGSAWRQTNPDTATPFATNTQVNTGTATDVAINPAGLQSRILTAPTATPTSDANKLVALSASGKIDSGFLSLPDVLTFKSTVDTTATYSAPTGLKKGDVYISANNGPPSASWQAVMTGTQTTIQSGELLIYNGTTFDVVQSNIDPSAYVSKSGSNSIASDMVMTFTASASLTTRIDGGNAARSRIDNFTIDGGAF